MQSGERHTRLGLNPGRPQHHAAIADGHARCRMQQCGLSDARISDEQQARSAIAAEHRDDRGHLFIAANQVRRLRVDCHCASADGDVLGERWTNYVDRSFLPLI